MMSDLYGSLTAREKSVLAMVADGRLNREIAAELDVSERSVKSWRSQIMEKFSVSSIVDLVRIMDGLKRSGIAD
jgi:FixJ family two-component response regulator